MSVSKLKPKTMNAQSIIKQHIADDNFPCLMGKSTLKSDTLKIVDYQYFNNVESTRKLYQDLLAFTRSVKGNSKKFYSFIASFSLEKIRSEKEFEKVMWQQLQLLNSVDNYSWDGTVSDNPEDNNFSFSVGGKAFYIVGMHPKSSRLSRQCPIPAMVFNLHYQFENLKASGKYQVMKHKIRDNDAKIQGDLNPMLEDFGADSEAKQYSGRAVDNQWKCPFLNQSRV
ncbi:guanitoxin biosynthesis heme-dependent pre-guanitoxin N-hydroxylase GntA [Fulvivirga ligni]|uniref:guanitoxin biosynthesis heme-dependent pre-guanitoxin N-hydroxylase GntA n=1 Tax=Fulvivirga ligni TaxID=2904246 RepID=UPI00272DDA7A|nr:guanitoxin biosynthesis heme-dependent pre-guanitoxin N-hydroxylase GntA [Fulvivirga ligni]